MGPGFPESCQESTRNRRRTLQSIRELSSQNGSLAGWRALSFESSTAYQQPEAPTEDEPKGQLEQSRVHQIRRKSLPSQGQGYYQQYQYRPRPLVYLSPDDTPSLYRSNTDPAGGKQVRFQDPAQSPRGLPGGHSRQHSLNSSVRARHSQGSPLSTVTEGQQIHAQRPLPRELALNYPMKYAQQPVSIGQISVRPPEGWNAQRERERMRREQETLTARLSQARERERNAAGVNGNHMVAQPASSIPLATTNPVFAQRHIGYAQPLSRSASVRSSQSVQDPRDYDFRYRDENQNTGWEYPIVRRHSQASARHRRTSSTPSRYPSITTTTPNAQPTGSSATHKSFIPRLSTNNTQNNELAPSKGRLEVFPTLANMSGEAPQTPATSASQQPPPPSQIPRRYSTPTQRTRVRSQSQPQVVPAARPTSLLVRENPDVARRQRQQHEVKPSQATVPSGFDTMAIWQAEMARQEDDKQEVQVTSSEKGRQPQRAAAAVAKSGDVALEKETTNSTSTWSSSSSAASPSKKKWARRSLSFSRGIVCRIFGSGSSTSSGSE
ncbi:unnamed protein product [Periconia digitata]|uniref:Uncharacterized protein n=1 Tax=Periconia digitata TaxID=1303443 RepID=A0A9W4UND2_9PLEO|nr:unnamed protein product [Periconia digitata]